MSKSNMPNQRPNASPHVARTAHEHQSERPRDEEGARLVRGNRQGGGSASDRRNRMNRSRLVQLLEEALRISSPDFVWDNNSLPPVGAHLEHSSSHVTVDDNADEEEMQGSTLGESDHASSK
jgi:hypothetical protein